MTTREQFEGRIASLDLGPIMAKLESDGLPKETIEELEPMYRNFLLLYALNPDAAIVPTEELDEFWHTHILDTYKYAEDCTEVFGFVLHHFPYYGMRDDQDAANLEQSFRQTVELYEATFGQPYRLSSQQGVAKSGGACIYVRDSRRPSYIYAS